MVNTETKELRGLAPADFLKYEQANGSELVQVVIGPIAKVFATAIAIQSGNSIEQELANVIAEWAKAKQAEAVRFVEAYDKASGQRKKQTEKEVERFIVDRLRAIGICAESQVKCSSGIADIVTSQCVIEVKPAIKSMRDANRAMGQATAYAKSIEKAYAIVCAMEISDSIDRAKVMHGSLVSATDIAAHFEENSLA